MKIGYAPGEYAEQSLALQLDALRAAGCRKVYEEIIGGGTASSAPSCRTCSPTCATATS